MAGGAETPNIAALPAIARLGTCESARGPDADRHVKLLSQFATEGSLSGAYSHFDGLYSGQHNDEIQLYAFDILALDGDDLRKLPLHLRKTNLARLLARRADGIHLAPFEQGEIGPDLFRAACDMMLEGLVSKRRDSRYRPGPSRDWTRSKIQVAGDEPSEGCVLKEPA
jgi:hypothetical protein